jgi:hypothetical protein
MGTKEMGNKEHGIEGIFSLLTSYFLFLISHF